jgi:hypothetical protein
MTAWWVLALVAVILALAAGSAAVVLIVVKKLPAADAFRVVGLGTVFGLLTALAIVGAVLAMVFKKGEKDEMVPGPSVPADSGSAFVGGAFNEARNRLRSAVREILAEGNSR